MKKLLILLLIVGCEDKTIDPLAECPEGYTYYDGYPDVIYGHEYQVCYYDDDLDVLKDMILLKNN